MGPLIPPHLHAHTLVCLLGNWHKISSVFFVVVIIIIILVVVVVVIIITIII
jgi:hypothetical protein